MGKHSVSGGFPQEDWNRLSDLHEYFSEKSKGRVSINDVFSCL